MVIDKRCCFLIVPQILLPFLLFACADYSSKYENKYGEEFSGEKGFSSSSRDMSSSGYIPVDYDYMTDSRDGKTYAIITIGNQTWMAKNLNYETSDSELSACYDNIDENCDIYGRLYTWAAAVGKTGLECGYGHECNLAEKEQGICPEKWRLPNVDDFIELINTTGEEDAGNTLKSENLWDDGGSGQNIYGFSLLPAGYGNYANFYDLGTSAYLWTSTEYSSIYANSVVVDEYGISVEENDKDMAFAVRCIYDPFAIPASSSSISVSSSSFAVMIDERDSQEYNIVTIGNQTWMAENLKYVTEESECYEGESSNCMLYGNLYSLEDALEVCPIGWHLPSEKEWNELFTMVEIPQNILAEYSNSFEFSAQLAGSSNGNMGVYAIFWTSNVEGYSARIDSYNMDIYSASSGEKIYVRCIENSKDENILVDARDGKSYRTVTIGSQTWMAENLNYVSEGGYADDGVYSWCYNNYSSNCDKYGRLYLWNAAVNRSWSTCGYGYSCSLSAPVQGICPDGWHLPSQSEFEQLIHYFDPSYLMGNTDDSYSLSAGKHLKSDDDWSDYAGYDSYGFAALPAGVYDDYDYEEFDYMGVYANFWSSTKYSSYSAYYLGLNNVNDNADLLWNNKEIARSVRCIKD